MRGLLALITLTVFTLVVFAAPQDRAAAGPAHPLGNLLAQIRGLSEKARDEHGQVLQSVFLPFGRIARPQIGRRRPNPNSTVPNDNNEDLEEPEDKPTSPHGSRPIGRRPHRPHKFNSQGNTDKEFVEKKRAPPVPNEEEGQIEDTGLDPGKNKGQSIPDEVPTRATKKAQRFRSTTPMSAMPSDIEGRMGEGHKSSPRPKTNKKPTSSTMGGIHAPPAHGTTEDWSDVGADNEDEDDEFHVTRRIVEAPCLGGLARDGSCREDFD